MRVLLNKKYNTAKTILFDKREKLLKFSFLYVILFKIYNGKKVNLKVINSVKIISIWIR